MATVVGLVVLAGLCALKALGCLEPDERIWPRGTTWRGW